MSESSSASSTKTCECKACTIYLKKSIPDKVDKRLVMITKMAIYEYAKCLVIDPVNWKSGEYSKTRYGQESIYRLLNVFGKCSDELYERLYEWITNHVPKLLTDKLNKIEKKEQKMTDFEFLAILGKKRNWKSGCAICIEDKPTGTICECGETQTMVFRPCGHTVCVNPCFNNILTAKHLPLYEQSYDMKNSSVNVEFDCPYCRQKVTYAFEAEKTLTVPLELISDDDILKLLS